MTFSRVSVRQMDRMFKAAQAADEPFDAPILKRYWADPEFRKQHDAETQSWRDRTNAMIDESMRRHREKRS